jgi:hypothetical protein
MIVNAAQMSEISQIQCVMKNWDAKRSLVHDGLLGNLGPTF